MLKFFKNPFAITGTRAAIPDTDPGDDSVNYEEGFTLPYQLPKTNPLSKNVPRDQTNQLYYDITQELQLLQIHGTPDFITTALNGGVAYSYGIGDRVRYDDGTNGPRVFVSRKNANTSLPTVAADWSPVRDAPPVAVAAGTANALTATLVPSLGVVPTGTVFYLRHANANTAAATLALNGGAAKSIVRANDALLAPGDIPGAGSWGLYVYDLTLDKYVLLNPAAALTGQTVVAGGARGLQVRTNAATPNTIVDLSASELTVRNAAGSVVRLNTVATSADITVSGAGGLDTGVESADAWYAVFAIYNPASGAVSALLSLSTTAPTLPGGFSFFALVGLVRNAAGNFRPFVQRGSLALYKDAVSVLAAGAATSLTAVSLAAAVPPLAVSANLFLNKASPASAGESTANVFSRNSATSPAASVLAFSAGNVQGGRTNAEMYLDWPDSAPNVWYNNTSGSLSLSVNGYRLQESGAIG